MANNTKIILGIDPGTIIMGYGLIAVTGQQVRIIEMDVLKMNPKKDHYERLQAIHDRMIGLIRQHKPVSCAIEAPFFGKNVQSMLKLGRAQGVAIATAMQAGVRVSEYSPKKVKQSITGNGNANKEQVWQMLQRILSFSEQPEYLDATDALAVAVCHHFQETSPLPAAGKSKGWDKFLQQHPERLCKP
ncbi:crossover junction endodeoxyribonuclease RuvC [Chitinophaga sp. GCM10012297]|uniref:Crossover junction endodeoxyribonuclease RuvC n=1 Tax=Chitinophaga chungangae TaxID=2821488 RepID=A0ABS3YCQ7_9BACT|nr:crossover junction endodeoxyribonuclease RuvC [Chitinophaga chungangae]MBO9152446.1 crossover junction endodeoxyribonuclease RuvC [Chitinophaga chungangae]